MLYKFSITKFEFMLNGEVLELVIEEEITEGDLGAEINNLDPESKVKVIGKIKTAASDEDEMWVLKV